MCKIGDIVSLIDELGSVTGPYLYLDFIVPEENKEKYGYTEIMGNKNMRYYVLMREKKIIFVLGGWGTIIPFQGHE